MVLGDYISFNDNIDEMERKIKETPKLLCPGNFNDSQEITLARKLQNYFCQEILMRRTYLIMQHNNAMTFMITSTSQISTALDVI